jgi:hypothetical protein
MLRDKGKQHPIVGALQPGYLPWIGFFDQVYHADLFILYDDLAYTTKSWRSRNRIKGPRGAQWLTVPVVFQAGQKIHQVEIDTKQNWREVHWKTIEHCYARADFFSLYRDEFREIYREPWTSLCDLNIRLTRTLLRAFGIRTEIVRSSDLGLEEAFCATNPRDHIATRRIVHFMNRFGATRFLEGQAGRSYIQEDLLKEAGITVRYQGFEHRAYPQLFGDFIPFLSAVDLLFNLGPRSLEALVNPSPFSVEP